MEEYLVSEVERFEGLVPSIIDKVRDETADLRKARKIRKIQEKAKDILYRCLSQFIEGVSSPESILTALNWEFSEKLKQELQFKLKIEIKENIFESFWRDRALNWACQSIKGNYPSILDRVRTPREDSLAHLPPGSWFLSLRIKLKKPYLGKDDGEVHVQDNPICRDKVFQLPFIRSTTWKGNLLSTARLLGKDLKLTARLFGNSRGEEEGQAGRLYFYPTFFVKAGIDLITPLKRQTKTPKRGPLYLECIPSGEEGRFSLLYLADHPQNGKEQEEDKKVQEDLLASHEILQAMLFEYGFSAKKAEGYGTADENLTGEKERPLGRFSFNQKRGDQSRPVKTTTEKFNSIQELSTLIKSFAEGLKGE